MWFTWSGEIRYNKWQLQFIARLAKRGACLTEGETAIDGELIRSLYDDELSLTGLELQIGVTPHSVN